MGTSPRHLLLAVPLRKGKQQDLDPVMDYIKEAYGEAEARECADDLETIQQVARWGRVVSGGIHVPLVSHFGLTYSLFADLHGSGCR